MDLILLEKVTNVGDLGDLVKVKSGFGRNYLVPQGKAVPATKDNLAAFEARRAELEAAAKDKLGQAEARQTNLAEVVVEITANASEEGKLYGSIGRARLQMQFRLWVMKSTRAKLPWAKARSERLVSLRLLCNCTPMLKHR